MCPHLVGRQRNGSGNFATFAAIRLASSLLSFFWPT
jgi:hypothetical protein